jgi:hypothetical protein
VAVPDCGNALPNARPLHVLLSLLPARPGCRRLREKGIQKRRRPFDRQRARFANVAKDASMRTCAAALSRSGTLSRFSLCPSPLVPSVGAPSPALLLVLSLSLAVSLLLTEPRLRRPKEAKAKGAWEREKTIRMWLTKVRAASEERGISGWPLMSLGARRNSQTRPNETEDADSCLRR